MKGVLFSKVPRDVYSGARGKGRLEVFFNTLLRQEGRVPTLEKVLGPYTHEFEKKPYWEGFVWPQRIIGTINEPVDLLPFGPISSLCEKNNPRR